MDLGMADLARPRRVAIVGGGPSGLFTAWCLQRATAVPLDLVIFEASDRAGGKIVTGRFSALPARYEAGAAEFYDYSVIDEDPLRQLVAELGLPTVPLGGAAVVMDDAVLGNADDVRRHLGPAAWQALDAFDDRAKAAMTRGRFYEAGFAPTGTEPAGRFADFLATIAEPQARRYVETLVHSDLAAEPDSTSVDYGLQNYVMNDPAALRLYCIAGGNEQLVDALVARLDGTLRLSTRVEGVDTDADGRMTVRSHGPAGRRAEAFDVVILALPVGPLAALACASPALAAALADHVAHHDHPAHYLRVSTLFRRAFWRDHVADSFFMLDAFGGCCLYDESARDPTADHAVLGWLLGGDAAAELAGRPDEELVAMVLGSLPAAWNGAREAFVEARVHRWTGAVSALPGGWPPWPLDRRHRPDPAHPRLFVVGDYLFDSTLNGALDSASYVAGWVATQFAEEPGGPRS